MNPDGPNATPLLEASGIIKSFGDVHVLKGISFGVTAGEILAVMGENGAGKSTLMNILSGVLSADSGAIHLENALVAFSTPREANDAGVVMVHQELNIVPDLSIAENVFLGVEPCKAFQQLDFVSMRSKTSEVLNRLACQLDPAARAGDLRVAEQQVIEIACALVRDARLLILDEPTAALSETEAAQLFRILDELRNDGLAIIYISHRMDEVFELADRLIVLRDGAVAADAPIGELDRAQVIRHMVGKDVDEFFSAKHSPGQEILLQVRDLSRLLSAGSEGAESANLEGIDFEVRRGEIFGIAGLLGAGRTELLEVLAGDCKDPWGGSLTLDGKKYRPANPAQAIRSGVAYITEDRKGNGLVLTRSVADNVSLASLDALQKLGWIQAQAVDDMAERAVTDLGIRASSIRQEVGQLSGGNQQKVVLAKWLATEPRLLLLDEPTRGIDVGAKSAIYELMSACATRGIAQILVSSDWPELIALSDRVLVLQDGRPAALLEREDCTQERLLDYASSGGPVQEQFLGLRQARAG
jgi:ribose transport system ATP-binding protein